MAKAPPTFTIPPPPPKKTGGQSENSTFTAFMNAHKALKPYAQAILAWTRQYGGVTATELAAVIWAQSGGNPASLVGLKTNVAPNTTNQAGIAFGQPTSKFQEIQLLAWQMSGAVTVAPGGDIDTAYKSINPSYTGADISSILPKGYVPLPASTPTQTATGSVARAAAKTGITDPWVVMSNGKLKLVYSGSTAPANAVKYGGIAIHQSEFIQVWKQTYADTFQAYTGKAATAQQIVGILKNAPSVYGLANQLATQPGFNKSPVYRQHAPGLQGIVDSILGKGAKIPSGLLATAIAQNWDQATFEQHLRTLPAYRQGPEFKTNLDQNLNAFEQIYGTADTAVKADLANKTAAGWTPLELQSWLRSQDSYKFSQEYQSKMLSFLGPNGLAMITGTQATLSGQQVDQMLNAQNQLKKTANPNVPPKPAAPTGAGVGAGVGAPLGPPAGNASTGGRIGAISG